MKIFNKRTEKKSNSKVPFGGQTKIINITYIY